MQFISTPKNGCVSESGKHKGTCEVTTSVSLYSAQPELDGLPSIVYCFRPKTLFLISPNFSFVRLKVAFARHLLHPKYLS